ncbi:MAG: carboxypeptidase-like regulatory domain-containing protein [Bryobacteraceae bacterium]|nr:carboxypeptidase-like regulatory domain-containing protein [Bryobacteraceae bacterium]
MPGRRNIVARLAFAGALLASSLLWSQESRGTVGGRLTDSSGAVIPAVSVQVTNLATGVSQTAVTNEQGNYVATFLIPGNYRITAAREGFRRVVREGIEVRVNDRLEINLVLEPGQIADSVTVQSEAPLLDTVGASLGLVVDSRRVAELPINHGDPYLLMRLAGGVTFTRNFKQDSPWEPLGNTGYAMAGSRSSRAEFTLDGASNTTTDQARFLVTPAYTPPADAVAEFKIQTAAFDATTGQTEGGVVNVSLKSGTNSLHGSAYWAKQDPSMNANLWFSNRAGLPHNDLNYNRWGGTLGGPVMLGKLYNGRNKTFFMFAYEKINQVTPSGLVATVPPAEQRAGDFSALLKLGSNYQIYDPFTRAPAAGGRFSVQPIPGNIIPPSRISPIAKSILSYYPLPSESGTADGANNYPQPSWPGRVKYYNHLYKFDHNFSEKNRAFFRMNYFNRRSTDADQFGFDNPALGAIFWQESQGYAFDDVHVFTPSFVMNVRASDSFFVRAQDTTLPGRQFDMTKLGLPASIRDQITDEFRRFPQINIQGYTSLGARPPLYKPTETRSAATTFDWIRGAHAFKFGAEFRDYRENQRAGSTSTPLQLDFNPQFAVGPLDNSPASPRGQGLASLLLGVPTGGTLTLPADYAQRSTMWAGLVQDEWKLFRKLTLTLGLRYELEGPLTERFNRSVRGFDPNATLPIDAQVRANYARNPTPEIPPSQFSARGGLTFAGVNGEPSTLFARDTNNLMPRIGVAFAMTRKTVFRGGYGVYYGALGGRRGDVIQTGFSQDSNVVPSLDGGLTFNGTLGNPFPNGVMRPLGAAAGPMTFVGNGVSFFNSSPNANQMQKWQFGFQQELPGRWVLDTNYQGSRGSDLEVTRALSALPNQYLSTSPVRDNTVINYLSANLPSPFAGLLPGTGRAGNVIQRAALLTPFPQFTGVSTTTNDGSSSYHALNAKIERRFYQGFTVQTSYTWSKFLEATTLLNAADFLPSRVISDEDSPHRVTFSWVYEMPFGRGRSLLSKLPRVPSLLVSGWQLSGIYTYQAGTPLGFGNAILLGDIRDVPLPAGQRTVDHWFNTDKFDTNSARQLARNVRTMSLRFSGIRGDAYNYWDLSLLKNVNITEKVKLEFRGEALNLLNHVAFADPDVNPVSTSFGRVTSEKGMPRRIQLTLRLKF